MGWSHSHDVDTDVAQLSPAPEGGWTWFTDPRAVDYNGHTYLGYVKGDNGDVVARSYDHATETLSAETVLNAALDVDDHANPSFLVRASDRKIWAFYTAHNDAAGIRMRLSTSAEDISAFDAEVVVDPGGGSYDYASPHQLTEETDDPIYLFHRDSFRTSGSRELAYIKSTDGGATWGSQVILLQGGGRIPYWKHASSGGDRIDFAVSNGHPTVDGANTLLHFYYQGGQWFQTDGTEITSPPFAFSELTEVWATGKSWVHDVAMGLDGHPRIVFAYFPTDSDHRYYYARWTGTAWETNEVVAAGGRIVETGTEDHYSGGVVLDHQDPRVLYASLEVDGTWEMRRYMTDDGGASFHVTPLTSGSSVKNIRPAPVQGHHSGPLSVLWQVGTYSEPTDWSTGVYEADTVLPHTETSEGSASLTIEDEGTALATAATTLDFVGDGVTASGTGSEKTITIPGATEGSGEILISDTPSTPLVFGDLIQNEAQDDLVYAD